MPWKFDFDKAPVGKPPLTWLGAGGKYAVVEDPDDKEQQGPSEADGHRPVLPRPDELRHGRHERLHRPGRREGEREDRRRAGGTFPTAAVINSRYVLVLDGMRQVLQIHIWPSALPDERNPQRLAAADDRRSRSRPRSGTA